MNAKEALGLIAPQIDKVIAMELRNELNKAKTSSTFIGGLNESILEICKGGKRIRGAFTYYSYMMFGGKDIESILKAAAFVEIIHSQLLIADDIIDEDDFRRGVPTIHKIYNDYHSKNFSKKNSRHFGNSVAICASLIACYAVQNILLSTNFDNEKKIQALDKFYTKMVLTGFGEVLDVLTEVKDDVSIEDAMEVNFLKTSIYTYEAPLHLGATLAGANEEQLKILSDYSIPAGIAFQIQDDILGIFGNEEKIGKPADSDIKEGKKNILTIKTLELLSDKDKEVFLGILGNPNSTADEVNIVREMIKNSGALEYSRKTARDYVEKALLAIREADFADEGKEFLIGIAEYMIQREV